MQRFITFFLMFFGLATPAFADTQLYNPVSRFPDIQSLVVGILKVGVMLSLPVVGFFIVYAGFKFVTAGGNSGKIDEAKKNFTYVIYGTVLILGAWVLASLIAGTIQQIVSGNGSGSPAPSSLISS